MAAGSAIGALLPYRTLAGSAPGMRGCGASTSAPATAGCSAPAAADRVDAWLDQCFAAAEAQLDALLPPGSTGSRSAGQPAVPPVLPGVPAVDSAALRSALAVTARDVADAGRVDGAGKPASPQWWPSKQVGSRRRGGWSAPPPCPFTSHTPVCPPRLPQLRGRSPVRIVAGVAALAAGGMAARAAAATSL